ncbi:MAG: 2-C-methyl-D-erythritol 2,4-cyclodiphosphate synthase [Candidatus Dasytiphilus stammeri]
MILRIGHGFDVHPFSGKSPLIIGGVKIPNMQGVLAYSDGDVVIHSVIDAILGAAALGDIGHFFPNNKKDYKNANSRWFLCTSWQYVKAKGYKLGNVDITIITQVPLLFHYFPQMCSNLAQDLESNINNVNIKATTTEKLGFIGREEGIACEAIVLLQK